MKQGWTSTLLGEVCSFQKAMHDGSAKPYIGLEDIEGSTGKFLGTLEPRSAMSNTFVFSKDHILYGRLRPYLNKVLLPKFSGHCSTEIYPILPTRSMRREFLFYWLIMERTVEEINSTCTGARMPRANMDAVLKLPFNFPPIPEQKRIVAILDDAFAGIDAAIANTEKNIENAQEIFENSITAQFSVAVNGSKELTLHQVSCDFGRGKSKHRPRNAPVLYGGPYPFIQTGDVRNADRFILEYSQTYSEVGLAQSKLWPKGTVCITIAANIAETAILGVNACFPDSVIGLVPDQKKTLSEFVYYLILSVQTQLKAEGKGSAQDNINLATFENRRFQFPPLIQQETIVDTLNEFSDAVRDLVMVYERRIAALTALKQSILQKAFAGELTTTPTRRLEAAVA